MKFNKGRTKTGGRSKGTPNRSTEELRAMLSAFVDKNMDAMQKDFDELAPRERVRSMIDLMKFVLPTLRAIDNRDTLKGVDTIRIAFDDPRSEVFNVWV